ncbi:MAG: hypothetical protein ETSY1_00865 [Candidatus Entotheonella factor]|uniref:Pyrrolo-quinoline quinone repeat domain-containing protein n=1 Tax=Entotheonella factor TaxID=1429438 RepID=W4LZ73_ENTF1|nr:MAG: hypothetical protein ETSY1_00865 [Candidatus Entotheonella factor]
MNRIVRNLAFGGLTLLLCLLGTAGWAQDDEPSKPVTDVLLAADPAESWLHTNGNWAGQRYSTLSQLNAYNVKGLKVAWMFSTGGKTDAQNTPLYHDGLIYFAQDNQVFAINARSGKQVWLYTHELPEDFGGYNVPFITGKHRGVALYGEHIYFLSNDTKLHAIHYKTGQPKFVKQYLKYPKKFEEAEDANGYATTVGSLAIPGKILVPLNGTDWGGLPGFVYAVHPDNGEILWQANMIPGPGEPGAETWPGDSREYGGAGPWITGSWDPELKMYYTGTANAYPWNPKTRGDGKYDNVGAASVVAINTDTGKVVWRYVVVPGDPWDYDTMSTPVIIKLDGEKVLVQPNKTGYVHYLDPKTGQFLRAVAFADKINWAKGYDVEGRPIDQIALPKEGADPVEVWPSLLGAVNMYPTSYSPKTGLIYLPAVNAGMEYGYEEIKTISNVRHFGAYQEFIWGYEVNLALNPQTGQEVWRDQKSKHGYAGGMLSTAGNVVFYTSASGQFHATNAATGEILYTFNLGTTAKAGPITFMLDGKQYVVQAVGGVPGFGYEGHNLQHGNMVVAFTR